ncbi:MFS transporter, DHA2 family, multidrug resistance protein [Raineyella antarctica]|uniref:MFS transporter, DHA2 family, multidrug resistance protein n=1 Tax=Raineyella antarctica TaxID=1577474 RepID=A0A1G6GDL8_9ACTN|nr:MFS transporter [Raineyella antarctica]SDB80009.1 MFS transporter, DHA2 family, multidrug resistance protein [Raineyella antarctica]
MTTTVMKPTDTGYKGTEKLLWGIVLAVVTYWLFAGTMGTVAVNVLANLNRGGEVMSADGMNLAVAITALFSGMFIVVMGGVADRIGRVKITLVGNLMAIVGSLLVVLATGNASLPLMLAGRAIQGFSAACIMPASMALVKTYWDGAARQRAVSMWSIGSWGGSGLAAIFGGYMATMVNWRAIFIVSIIVSVVSILMIVGTPESKVAATGEKKRFDVAGMLVFMVTVLVLLVVLTFGGKFGWGSPLTLVLAAAAVLGIVGFLLVERGAEQPFVDFKLFENRTFTGATISNFILNASIGMLIVSQQLLQLGGRMSASQAGLLTLGYAITIIGFIRVGEKLLQRFGPRKPMVWGSLIVGLAVILLLPTNLLLEQYKVLAIISYALFGLGLAFYATPSTDAALSNLPAAQAGSGAGIYKMASSLGGAIGAAASLVLFTGFAKGGPIQLVGNVLVNHGLTVNVAVRQAAFIALLFNLVMVALAVVSIMSTVPKGREVEAQR